MTGRPTTRMRLDRRRGDRSASSRRYSDSDAPHASALARTASSSVAGMYSLIICVFVLMSILPVSFMDAPALLFFIELRFLPKAGLFCRLSDRRAR